MISIRFFSLTFRLLNFGISYLGEHIAHVAATVSTIPARSMRTLVLLKSRSCAFDISHVATCDVLTVHADAIYRSDMRCVYIAET